MEFKVKFVSTAGLGVIDLSEAPLGMHGLDKVRNLVNLPHLSADRVHPMIYGWYRIPVLTISESTARKSKRFGHVNEIQVVTEPKRFSRFVFQVAHIDADETTGEVREAGLKHCLDEGGVIDAWTAAGCPVEWDTAPPTEGSA